jgi:hypothetical protein
MIRKRSSNFTVLHYMSNEFNRFPPYWWHTWMVWAKSPCSTIWHLRTFRFPAVSQSITVYNAVFGILPKRLLLTMVKNQEFLGTAVTNPSNFRHFGFTQFVMQMKVIPHRLSVSECGARKYNCHDLQNYFWRLWHSPFELGTPDHTWYVHKLLFYATFRSQCLWWAHLALGKR